MKNKLDLGSKLIFWSVSIGMTMFLLSFGLGVMFPSKWFFLSGFIGFSCSITIPFIIALYELTIVKKDKWKNIE